MKRYLFLVFLVTLPSIVFGQSSNSLSLKIIDPKVCLNKKNSAISFSYYFENTSDKHLVVLDHYEPCFWERSIPLEDSNNTLGLVLIIKDDSGRVVKPLEISDTTLTSEGSKTDSLLFFEEYEKELHQEFEYHTRSLRPHDVLINLYALKLNRRKCFFTRKFEFDPSRKYTLRLLYIAANDVHRFVRKSSIGKHDELFIGHIASNEVELCFK